MLEILNNRTINTHENEQFRRVVNIIEATFEKFGYNGLLIGNPFNESYYRFRADAILYYDHGVILFDFKDYKGIIKLPSSENDFHTSKWHNESSSDRSRLEIKAGSKFINPFRQLVSYRNAFRELVEKNKYLEGINPARVCIANIFSGPIEIHNEVPRNLPYYKLIQESNLSDFLYDFSSDNSYVKENAEVFKTIFPAERWIKSIGIESESKSSEKQIIEIDKDVESSIIGFLQNDNGGILVLESMDVTDRDSWLKFISNEAVNYNIPQIEKWCHSTRISKKIQKRSNIETDGIYSVIFGGSDVEGQNDFLEKDDQEEELLEVIPLKSNKDIDEKAVIIIVEAHLINRSLNQSELLRFGSGRLLEDIIKFLDPKSSRKIVFIGDPYSLTFGKDEDSALNMDTLGELYEKSKIIHFRKPINEDIIGGKEKLRTELASSIEKSIFNNLNYYFDGESLIDLHDDAIRTQYLNEWFAKPLNNEPENAVLFYSKKDCQKTNIWIKKHCLKNGDRLASGDLLLVNNNVSIPDESGFQIPRRIVNGMFLAVLEVNETLTEHINIRQAENPVVLCFTKLKVRCLSLVGTPETYIWILDNYFKSEDELTKEEQIAFRVYINSKINAEKLKNNFEYSPEHRLLLLDNQFKNITKEEQEAITKLIRNYSLPKEKREKVETTRSLRNLLSIYFKKYSKRLFYQIKDSDPFINAVFVKYGWAITVHKAIGSNYNEVILKGHRKENDGITNDSYFRWLYSGVTSSKNIKITSPQRIHPMMNCVFEDNSTIGFKEKSNQFLTFENYKVELNYTDKLKSIENTHVVGAICEISKSLEQKGYIFEEAKKVSDYLTKTYYSIPDNQNKQLILNIDNKGAKDSFAVSNVRIDNLNGADESIINNCIRRCFEITFNSDTNKLVKDELQLDYIDSIYRSWFEKFENININLTLIKRHNNQDLFRINHGQEYSIFRVWYGTSEKTHTKGFISKIEVLEKSSDLIINIIKKVCLGITE